MNPLLGKCLVKVTLSQEPIIRPTSIENHNKSPDKKNSEAWLREHVISLFKPELYTMRKVLNCMNKQNGVRFKYFKYVGFDTTRRMLN